MSKDSDRLYNVQRQKITTLESCLAVRNRVSGISEALKEASSGDATDKLLTGAEILAAAAEERAKLMHEENTVGGVGDDKISKASTKVADAANVVKALAEKMLESTLPPEVQGALSDIVADADGIAKKLTPNR